MSELKVNQLGVVEGMNFLIRQSIQMGSREIRAFFMDRKTYLRLGAETGFRDVTVYSGKDIYWVDSDEEFLQAGY